MSLLKKWTSSYRVNKCTEHSLLPLAENVVPVVNGDRVPPLSIAEENSTLHQDLPPLPALGRHCLQVRLLETSAYILRSSVTPISTGCKIYIDKT